MNGPGSHQHRGLGMQGRFRAVVTAGTPAGPHSRPPAPPHARGGWHPHSQHPQHAQIPQQYTGNKEYPYRQCPPPRFHNGYTIAVNETCRAPSVRLLFFSFLLLFQYRSFLFTLRFYFYLAFAKKLLHGLFFEVFDKCESSFHSLHGCAVIK